MFETRTTDELVRIVRAGGGFSFDAKLRSIDDVVRIANEAGASGARITFRGLTHRMTDELVRIASAGRGAVSFED